MRRSGARRHFALAVALSLAGCGEPAEGVRVWPIGADVDPHPLSSTFGPRVQGSQGSRYDFHRGIDIPVPPITTVHAIAAGVVKRAGRDAGYADQIVQLEHCAGGDCYYSNYSHLAAAVVAEGDQVERGQPLGVSGVSESGFPHLHFEIREGRSTQDHCVHPLRFLPGAAWFPPSLRLGAIDDTDPLAASVEVVATTPGSAPGLRRVEIATSDRATGAPLEERVFDFEEWNRKYTPEGNEEVIDDPDLEGIHVDPAEFNEESALYEVRLRFGGLLAAGQPGDLRVVARARDVDGQEIEVRSP